MPDDRGRLASRRDLGAPCLAQRARHALTNAGYHPLVITGDGLAGCPSGAPYDRVISTAAVREAVPRAWLDQLRPGGRLVTPWGTDWSNGGMLTLDLTGSGVAGGRFAGDLAFMRIRSQRRALYGWQPGVEDLEMLTPAPPSAAGATWIGC